MCGFFAVIQDHPTIERDAARRGLSRIAHRGPDASAEWCSREVFLGHRRLSIIDLATGDQPMQSADGRHVIVFNGEIYNFPELKKELVSSGAVLRTRSDTEVILEGYRRWGSRVVERLNGIFAFVIWDEKTRTIFGARDRLGIKPLCWTVRDGALIVSSTLEPFHALKGFEALDPIAVRDLMAFDYIPAPRTILAGVHKLEPGTRFTWTFGKAEPSMERYWRPPLPDAAAKPPDEHELETLLEFAVKRQMISDVPIGVFLSGGIDSSLMVALMARHSERPVQTFSVAFSDGNADESSIARVVAQHYGTTHNVLRAEDLSADELLALIGRMDEPFTDPAFIRTYSLSAMTRSCVKVALSGDGGDEVFGGYPKYILRDNGPLSPLYSMIHGSLQAIPCRPRGMGRIYERALSTENRVRFQWARYGEFPVFRKDIRQLFTGSFARSAQLENYFEPWERRARSYGKNLTSDLLMRADLETYLSENCLFKTDRASMLASLEVRVPFLDETVLERILPLSAEQKMPAGQLKALLLPIVRRLLPEQVWNREKHGFNVPTEQLMAGSWRPAVEEALSWGEANFNLFNYGYLKRLHAINRREGGIDRELWNPFVLLAWAMARARKPESSSLGMAGLN